MIYHLRKFDESEIAGERLKIINFYQQYGERATKQAFGADRKVVSRWRQRLADQDGRLVALVPKSTRPHHTRIPVTESQIIDWIKKERKAHPGIGKEKLKPDLDEFCQSIGVKSVSASTIGNIIKRHQFFYQKPNYRVYHDPNSAWAGKTVKRKKRLRIKHSPKPEDYGHIEPVSKLPIVVILNLPAPYRMVLGIQDLGRFRVEPGMTFR